MSPRTFRRKPSSQLSTPITPTPSTFRFSPHSHDHDGSFLTTPTTPGDENEEYDDQRWSEIIPPKTALAFSPVWDPEYDTVQFTQAQLQGLSTPSLNAIDFQISPSDAVSPSASISGLVGSDSVSQVLSIGNSTLTLPLSDSGLPTSTLQYFQDQYRDYLFSGPSSRVCHGERGSTTENGHGAELGDHSGDLEQWENEEKLELAASCRRRKITRTQTSSTMDGLDVYLRGSLMANAHDIKNNSKKHRYFSCLEYFLDKEFEFDPSTPFARQYAEGCRDRDNDADDCVSDEGFFEVSGLGSRKGTRHHERQRPQSRPKAMTRETTTATTNPSNTNPPPSTSNISEFMSITDLQEDEDEEDNDTSSQWSALDPPEHPAYAQLLIADQQRNSLRGGRLRKRRPSGLPAPPAEVLQREVFSHQVSVPVPGPAQSMLEGLKGNRKRGGCGNHSEQCQTLNNIVHRLGRKKSSAPAVERWMCVEVTQEVRWA